MSETVYEDAGEDNQFVIFYPFPGILACTFPNCSAVHKIRTDLYKHYVDLHGALIKCGGCKLKNYTHIQSMTAHITRCRRANPHEFELHDEEMRLLEEGSVTRPNAREKWTRPEKVAMAELEVNAPPDTTHMNDYLASIIPNRSRGGIQYIRLRDKQYKHIIAEMKVLEKTVMGPDPEAEQALTQSDISSMTQLEEAVTQQPSQPRTMYVEAPAPDVRPLVDQLVQCGLREELSVALALGPGSWTLIESIFRDLNIKPVVSKAKAKTGNPRSNLSDRQNRSIRKRREYAKQQELFKKSRKTCMDYLRTKSKDIPGEDSTAAPTYDNIKGVFESSVAQTDNPRGSHVQCDVPRIPDETQVEPLLPEEVKYALNGCTERSAVGPDGYGFGALKKINPFILATLFNGWLVNGRVPDELKNSRTVMIPKSSAPKTANDFRPLTIGPALLRLFTKILFNRMYGLLKPHDLQAGFCLDRSCSNNTIPLEAVIRHRRREMKSLYAAFLDLSKAFDCVPHSRILQAMEDRGFPRVYTNIVQDLYKNNTTIVYVNGISDRVPIACRRGVKQGDPLSPYLFALVVDPLLYLLNTHSGALRVPRFEHGSQGGDEAFKYGSTAFADDFVIISETQSGAQAMLDEAVAFFEGQGLSVNPTKTVLFGWEVDKKKKQIGAGKPLEIMGTSIAPMRSSESVKYLGIRMQYHTAPVLDVDALKSDLECIARSRLKPFQKKELVQSVVQPKVLYSLVNTTKVVPEARKADRIIRRALKSMMHLPQQFPDELMYMRSRDGGLGLLHLEDTSRRVQCKAIARLKRSTSPVLASILAEPMMAKHIANLYESLGIPDTITDRNQLSAALESVRKDSAEARRSRYTNQELFLYVGDRHSNAWLGDKKYMQDCDKLDSLRLRANLSAVRNLTNRASSDPAARMCRRCKSKLETVAHVLQNCPSVLRERSARHNFIRDRVFDLVKRRNPGVTWIASGMEVPMTCVSGTRCRPDIFFETAEKVYILDPTIPWDSAHSMQYAYNSKFKYQELEDNYPGKRLHVIPVVFGARGLTHPKTVRALKTLNLTDQDVAFLAARTLVGSNILMTRFMMDRRR